MHIYFLTIVGLCSKLLLQPAASLLNLHNTEALQWQQTIFLANVTRNILLFYKIDNVILYYTPNSFQYTPLMSSYTSSRSSIMQETANPDFGYKLLHSFKVPLELFTIEPRKNNSIPNLGLILAKRNLALVLLDDIFHKGLEQFVATSLGASTKVRIIFALFGSDLRESTAVSRLQKLRAFFRWCWSRNLLNVILIYQANNVYYSNDTDLEVYTYTPFPVRIELIRLTMLPFEAYFTDKVQDVLGYAFKTVILPDKPNFYVTKNQQNGEQSISGIVGRLCAEFIHKLNGTLTQIPSDSAINSTFRLAYMKHLLETQTIDIGIHPYTFLIPYDIFGSFPITHTNACVVVPVVPEIYHGFYLPYTFNAIIWLLLLIIFMLFVLLHMASNYQQHGKLHAYNAFANTLQGMLNITQYVKVSLKNVRRLCGSYLMNFLLVCTGLIFTHLQQATLTSLLSTTMYGKQLETIEDLLTANITLMVLDYNAYLYEFLEIFPHSFNSQLLIAEPDTIALHMYALDTSYGYIVLNEQWKVMRGLQANLWKPLFKIVPELCISNLYLAIPMQFNSPFYHSLKHFTLWVQAYGFDTKWSNLVHSEIQHDSLETLQLEQQMHPIALTMAHLLAAWCIWMGGLFVAFLVFCSEVHHNE